MTVELCPGCRDPLQGLVCHCGTDLREVDVIRCDKCGKPAVKEETKTYTYDTGHPMHRTKRGRKCQWCQ